MNILFYRYGSICEPDVLETFGKFGFNVYEIKDEISDKNITPAQGIAILNKVLDKKNVDVIFTINFYPFISEVCNIYKIPYISWIVDSPVVELVDSALGYSPLADSPFVQSLADSLSKVEPADLKPAAVIPANFFQQLPLPVDYSAFVAALADLL